MLNRLLPSIDNLTRRLVGEFCWPQYSQIDIPRKNLARRTTTQFPESPFCDACIECKMKRHICFLCLRAKSTSGAVRITLSPRPCVPLTSNITSFRFATASQVMNNSSSNLRLHIAWLGSASVPQPLRTDRSLAEVSSRSEILVHFLVWASWSSAVSSDSSLNSSFRTKPGVAQIAYGLMKSRAMLLPVLLSTSSCE
jgi:hypothetical protein